MAAMSIQLQEVMSSVEMRSEVVGRKLEEVNGRFDHLLGAAHEAEVFKSWLDQMEERVCRCGQTPSEVGEDLSSEENAQTELSYASARGSKYVAPLVDNPIPIPIPAPCHPCRSSTVLPAFEEITEELTHAICDDLDALLREADVKRVRDLQEEFSNSVVRLPPQVGSESWRRLNGSHQMCPGPSRREQRATSSRDGTMMPMIPISRISFGLLVCKLHVVCLYAVENLNVRHQPKTSVNSFGHIRSCVRGALYHKEFSSRKKVETHSVPL